MMQYYIITLAIVLISFFALKCHTAWDEPGYVWYVIILTIGTAIIYI
jgi:hypothetical protein